MHLWKKVEALAPIKIMTTTINLFLMIRGIKLDP